MTSPPSLLVIAGEVSGDMHAAAVVRRLRELRPDLDCWGIGGDQLRAAGARLAYDVKDMAVMGLTEVLRRYFFFRRVFHDMLGRAAAARPDAVLLVDYPGFNLRFAARAHALGLKVYYYICPQVWAWHRGRIPQIARQVDRLFTIFPFEPALFAGTGLRVDFVGHPLVAAAREAQAAPPIELPWPGARRVALLPGSRPHEIRRILPVMAAAARIVRSRAPDTGFLVAAPAEAQAALARTILGPAPDPGLAVVAGHTREILRQARAGLVASGTATVEATLMGCPMAVVYRTAALTYWLARRLVKVPHIGMVNIVAGRGICPEFIQAAATPQALADALQPLLSATGEYATMKQELARVATALGGAGAAEKVAAGMARDLGWSAGSAGGA